MIKFLVDKLKNKFWISWALCALLALMVALMLWLPQFGKLPMGLNRDEAALGYNAFSILKTGKDEWGKSFPISITSFGDQKLPGYTYFLIPFIFLFDLEVWVVRLPSLLAGLVAIVSLGLIAVKLAKMSGFKNDLQLIFSGLAMMLTAISPWQMHFSRVAYETHLAMGFFLAGLAFFLFALDTKIKLNQRIFLVSSSLLVSFTLLTYHSYQIFIPLFLFSLIIIFFKKISKLDRVGVVTGAVIGLVTVSLLYFGGVVAANQVKRTGINPFTEQNLTDDVLSYRVPSAIPNVVERIGYNKFFSFVKLFGQNYVSTFSGSFFFIHGSGHGDHNPGNGRNLHLFTSILIIFGFFALWDFRKKKAAQLVWAWLIFALVPSSLTINPLLEVRIATVFPALNLLTAIGVMYALSFVKGKLRSIFIGMLVFVMLVSCYSTYIFYTQISPKTAVDNSTYHRLAKELYKYHLRSGYVLTQSPTSSPYIWYLFENKIDPEFALRELIHFSPTDEGFIHVRQLGNVFFEEINWEDLAERASEDPYVLIIKPSEFPREKWSDKTFVKLEEITDSKGEVIYEVYSYDLRKLEK